MIKKGGYLPFMGSLCAQKGDVHGGHREFKRFIYDVLL